MSGRYRTEGKEIQLLDKAFRPKKRSVLQALAAAGAVYLLQLLLGNNEYLFSAVLRPPVMGLLDFFGAFLALGILLVVPFVSPKLMNLVEFAVAVGAVVLVLLGALWQVRDVFTGGFSDAASVAAQGAGLWCGVCLIHNVRE